MSKVRVAVLGYGHLGKWHCQKVAALSEMAEFVAIVEKFPNAQEAARMAYPHVKVVSDVREIINEIDAAFIVTPTSVHFELVKFLIQSKKHIFCEKPICSNDQEAMELKKLTNLFDRVLQVGHSERFHEAWERLLPKFKDLKAPYTIRLNRSAPFKGRATDVDVVQDLAIHDLDLLMYLFKERPLKIKAHGLKIRTSNWDHANIHVSMEKECEAYIEVSRNHVKEVRDLEIISKDGMIFVDLFTNKILEAPSGQNTDGTFVKEESYQKRDHLLLEHQHFYQSILKSQKIIVPFKDGIDVVHLIDCTLKSMKENRSIDVKFTHD